MMAPASCLGSVSGHVEKAAGFSARQIQFVLQRFNLLIPSQNRRSTMPNKIFGTTNRLIDLRNKQIDTKNRFIDTQNKHIDIENRFIDTENKHIDTQNRHTDTENRFFIWRLEQTTLANKSPPGKVLRLRGEKMPLRSRHGLSCAEVARQAGCEAEFDLK